MTTMAASVVQYISPRSNVLQSSGNFLKLSEKKDGKKKKNDRAGGNDKSKLRDVRCPPGKTKGQGLFGRGEVSVICKTTQTARQNLSFGKVTSSKVQRTVPNPKQPQIRKREPIDTSDSSDEEELPRPKKKPIVPDYVTNSDMGKPRKTIYVSVDGKTSKTKLSEVGIQQRNARERNRVKLVNSGFAALRSHIPDYITKLYDKEQKKRKKLSKVETLRMAVDYIRHLEQLLGKESTSSCMPDIKIENSSNSSTGYPSPTGDEYQRSYTQSPATASPTSQVFLPSPSPYEAGSPSNYPQDVIDYSTNSYITYEYVENLVPPTKSFSPEKYSKLVTKDIPGLVKLEMDELSPLDEVAINEQLQTDVPYSDNGRFVGAYFHCAPTDYPVAKDTGSGSNKGDGASDESSTSPLPSIGETFYSKNIASAFFDVRNYLPYQLVESSSREGC